MIHRRQTAARMIRAVRLQHRIQIQVQAQVRARIPAQVLTVRHLRPVQEVLRQAVLHLLDHLLTVHIQERVLVTETRLRQ